MASNPQLFGNGTPVPFVGEIFVLTRDSVEFQVENVPDAPGGKLVAKGTILISNVRIVFVASKPVGHIAAFDLPLADTRVIPSHDLSGDKSRRNCVGADEVRAAVDV